MTKYKIEIENEVADQFLKNILTEDYIMVKESIARFEAMEPNLTKYQYEDLQYFLKWKAGLDILLEIYLTHDQHQELINHK